MTSADRSAPPSAGADAPFPPVPRAGIRDTVAAIRDGRATSRGLLDAARAAAERHRDLNAIAWVDWDAAARAADALDARARAGTPTGPLHGVPVTIKDLYVVDGAPTAAGTRAALPALGGEAVAVSRLRAAGALPFAKTNMHEIALGATGENPHTGDVKNPFDPARQAGGSSSGAGVATAVGIGFAGLGSDTGGSVRIPAAFCGVVGFKPSFGLINRYGVKQLADSFDTVGTFARSVEDTLLLVGGLTGRSDLLEAAPARPTHIALCLGPDADEAEAPMRAALEAAMAQLSAAGVRVSTLTLPPAFDGMGLAHKHIEYFELARALQHEYRVGRSQLSAAITSRIEAGLALAPADYEAALALRDECRLRMRDLLAGVDLLLAPAAPGEAPTGLASTGKAVFNRLPTALGLPAITLPYSLGPKGLPLGLQFIGGSRGDAAVLAHAGWIEAALPRAY